MTTVKELREGSTRKRSAILAAAQTLFLADGFARTKMDAIAMLSGISKRTVYDYYGDKRALFAAVVEQVMRTLDAAVDGAMKGHLHNVTNLEESLIGFARTITASAMGSSEYAVLSRLLAIESTDLPDGQVLWPTAEPEEALAERFAEFDSRGMLSAPDPRRAADHFVALALSASAPPNGLRRVTAPSASEADEMIVDGVRAFLRAYRPDAPRP